MESWSWGEELLVHHLLMSGGRGVGLCPRLGSVLRADRGGGGTQEGEAGPVPTLSPGPRPSLGPRPLLARTEVLSGSPEPVMRGLAWGNPLREGFNCWGASKSPFLVICFSSTAQ